MKQIPPWLSLLPILALPSLGIYLDRTRKPPLPPRITTGPFRLVLAGVSVTTVQPGRLDLHDTNVTVAIDYQGPKLSWWGKGRFATDVPEARLGSSRLVDEHGKTYRPTTTSLYNFGQTFDPQRQQYIWAYYLNTAFVPDSVHHLTFKTQIIHPTGTLQISVPVRNNE